MNRTEGSVGKVWLAGAGPGDAELLTVKAKALLDKVDVVVYDALVSVEVLSLIPGDCQMIDVGKRSGHHPVLQDEINRILLAEAQKGKRVLRLKGGDPFVFGRGGEELELLAEAGIPFEVVPGITSAAAVPAYAGIPVTHRDFTSSFHIVTGHARKGGSSRINYKALVSMDATLVFLMGITALQEICKGLLDAGMAGETPAAILERGTTAAQRRVISTVAGLCEAAGRAAIGTPAIILVGRVCGLGEVLHWAEDRPLGGRQFLITRPAARASKLGRQLRDLGAQVIELPAISTRMMFPNEPFVRAIGDFAMRGDESWLVFTSPAGVESFFALLGKLSLDLRDLLRRSALVKTAAIGSATARELGKHGIMADVVPEQFCAVELGRELARCAKPYSRIVVMRAKEGSKELIPPLLEQGLAVRDVAIYETIYETHEQIRNKVAAVLEAGEIDAVTFTSASTVRGFVKMMGNVDYQRIQALCIGGQTAAAAREYQMQVTVAREASIDSMVEKLAELYGS